MNFNDILARCIDAIEQGATIGECLHRYPAQAAALEPLLIMVVRLSRASKTQMSSQAFDRGRAALAARTHQQRVEPRHAAIQHRRLAPIPARHSQRFPGSHNGTLPQRRPWPPSRSRPRLRVSHLLELTLCLLLIVGMVTFTRYVAFSLPGAPFYPVKSTGEQVVEILMEAAGEDITWHAGQTERYLQAMARLSQQDTATAQTLSQAIEEHWAAVLAAAQRLPVDERFAVLQVRIARLQQIEAAWAAPQGPVSTVAATTLRKLVTAGAQSLREPQAVEPLATLTPTTMLTPTPMATPTGQPPDTATPLLQASATASTSQPVLIASATPTEAPTEAPTVTIAPATATPLPPLPPTMMPSATPLPEIPVVIPRQETQKDESDSSDNDEEDSAESEAPSSADEPELARPDPAANAERPTDNTATTVTNTVIAVDETPELDPTSERPAGTETVVITPPAAPTAAGEQPAATAEVETPQATTTAETPLTTPTKTAPQATATDTQGQKATHTPAATDTPGQKATSTPAATKTPKPTATHANDEPEKPVATDAPTAATSTPAEKTPGPTVQPTANSSPAPQEATVATPATPSPSQPTTPRPTSPSGEATKVVRP